MNSRFLIYLRALFNDFQVHLWLLFFVLIFLMLVAKLIGLHEFGQNPTLVSYGILVASYILTNFILAYFYPTQITKLNKNFQPKVTFGIPAKNEQDVIYKTLISMAKSNYPKDKIEIIAINDGSTDNTWQEMLRAKKSIQKLGISVRLATWEKNKGKLFGLKKILELSKGEIIIFIDSDSLVTPESINNFIMHFQNPKVGGVSGHAYIANLDKNILTKLQVGFYFLSFSIYKAAESLFGCVTCCPGCCAAYRREYLIGILNVWNSDFDKHSKFSYVDDRNLTNYILQNNYKTIYEPKAIVHTYVPENINQFFKQQLRWNRSWFLENLNAIKFMWRKNPLMSALFYLGIIIQLLAPIMVFRALLIFPLTDHKFPIYYLIGILLMALIAAIYYRIYTKDKKNWLYAFFFPIFYTFVLVWLLPYAMVTVKDSRWGTR